MANNINRTKLHLLQTANFIKDVLQASPELQNYIKVITEQNEVKGLDGKDGIQGEQGLQGIQGDKGDTGEQGLQGIQGEKGDTGEQGLQGIQGEKGEKGLQGIQGDKGDTGEQGLQGIQGEKGDTGEQGLQGIQGEKGEKGLQGKDGIKGIDGINGINGIDLISNYGGSILRNGNLELGTTEGWQNAVLDTVDILGNKVLINDSSTVPTSSDFFRCSNKFLYKATFTGIFDPQSFICVTGFNNRVNDQNHSKQQPFINVICKTKQANVIKEHTVYFNFPKDNDDNMDRLGDLTNEAKFHFYGLGKMMKVSGLVIEIVPLYEPIPYTDISEFKYLRVGQFVLNETTFKYGRFNGTSINWFN